MDLKPGYKQTEAGLIPGNWDAPTIFEVCSNIIDYRGRTPRKLGMEWGGGDILALSAGNVKMGYIDFEEEAYFGSEALYKRWMTSGNAKKDDIVITMEAPLGNVALIPDNQKYILSQRTVLVQVSPDRGFSRYLFQLMMSQGFQSLLVKNATGSTAKGIQRRKFEKLRVALPPLPEQRAIAAALGDVDTLISTLDRLTAKKRGLKQAAMQQLLTGQQRLPGFSGEWEVKRLGDLFQFLNTANNPRADLSEFGDIGYIHYGDIHTTNSAFLNCERTSLPLIAKRQVAGIPHIVDGDLVMVDASEDYAGIGKCVEVQNVQGRKIVAGLHTFLLRGNRQLLADGFKGYLQFIPSIKDALIRLATGISVYGISKTNVRSVEVLLPKPDEQTAIAAVLSDMDSEIAALEQRRDKTRALKQGMMQELLTGKTRLI